MAFTGQLGVRLSVLGESLALAFDESVETQIDTAQLRRASTGVARPYIRSHFPDSVKDGTWRASVGLSYKRLTAEDEDEVEEEEVVGVGGAAIGPLPDFRDENKKDVDIAVALMLIT